MQDLTLPLLSKKMSSHSCCPNCGGGFVEGLAYLSGGALLLTKDHKESIRSDRFEGFLHMGFHGKDPEMRDSTDALIVDDVVGGQFDLQWCSLVCMREWLMRLVDELEARLSNPESDK
jgi:hypothetical protein